MTGTFRWIFTRVIPPALLALLPGVLLGQEQAVITGRVTDESARPIAAATVAIPSLGIGVKPQSVQVTLREGAINQDFSLEANPLQLGEIVVTGAGTISQTEKLGAVRNNVSGQEIERANESNVVQALAGKAPNVT